MDIERIVVRLVADASQYLRVLDSVQARLLAFGGFVGGYFSRQAMELAADYERAGVAFEVMTKSATTGKKLLDSINKLAIETPFTSSELVKSAKQVMAFGFEVEDVLPIISKLGDISVATGSDMDRLVLALGQVRTTGRLMGQELRQFTNAGVPILEYLGRVLNVSSSQVPNLVRQGKISFTDVAKAINMMTDSGGLFAGMMDRINKETVSGRWANLRESMQLTGRSIGLAFFETFHLKEMLSELGDSLRGLSIDSAREMFIGLRIALYGTWETIKMVAKAMLEWGDRNKELIRSLAAAIILVKAFTTAIWMLGMAKAALIAFVTPVGVAVVALTALLAILNELGAFNGIGSSLAKGFMDFKGQAVEAWQGIVSAVRAGDMELAWNIVLKTMQIGWKTLLLAMEAEWEQFSFNFDLDVKANFDKLINNMSKGAQAQVQRILGDEPAALAIEKKFDAFNLMIDKGLAREKMARQPELDNRISGIMGRAQNFPERQQLQDLVDQAKMLSDPAIVAQMDRIKAAWTSPETREAVKQWIDAQQAVLGGPAAFDKFNGAIKDGKFSANAVTGTPEVLKKIQNDALNLFSKTGYSDAIRRKLDEMTGGLYHFPLENAPGGQRISTPIQISPEALHAAQELGKEFEQGATAAERFAHSIKLFREAADKREGFHAVLGIAGAMALPEPVMTKTMESFGIFKAFQKLQGEVGNPSDKFSPAMMKGSREAQETINRSNAQMLSTEDQVLQTLRFANTLHAEQVKYSKAVVDTITNNKEAAGIAKGLGLEGGK